MNYRMHGVTRRDDYEYILDRVEYYNKLNTPVAITSKDKLTLKEFIKRRHSYLSRYFYDTYSVIKGFDKSLPIVPLFGDVTTIPPLPSIVKSRPIEGDNHNSVVLKLDRLRHFLFLRDSIPFRAKDPRALGYTYAKYKQNRIDFLELYRDREEICICGNVMRDPTVDDRLYRDKITILDHLKFRYIIALEGNDVATNLKWIMSSNCIAVMPKPTYETWFMEGRLIPNYHYIEIKSDFSDLEERLEYYNTHLDEAEAIVRNGQEYIDQFRDSKREKIIGYMTMQRYFEFVN
ncbi:MAG: glycosyl transferase family 90 [Rikenellaceae bacterium]